MKNKNKGEEDMSLKEVITLVVMILFVFGGSIGGWWAIFQTDISHHREQINELIVFKESYHEECIGEENKVEYKLSDPLKDAFDSCSREYSGCVLNRELNKVTSCSNNVSFLRGTVTERTRVICSKEYLVKKPRVLELNTTICNKKALVRN